MSTSVSRRFALAAAAFASLSCLGVLGVQEGRASEPPAATKPTLYLIGDSTVKNGTRGLEGWGSELPRLFDLSRINVVNEAIGGRSSRSFLNEGRWAKVRDRLKPGDFVLMQFGHNDGGSPKSTDPKIRYRGSLRGFGDETVDVPDLTTGKIETVHTYGWYMRQYVKDTKAKGATPIMLSLIPRNDWKDGKVARSKTDGFGFYAHQVADSESIPFVDLNGIIADKYDAMGQDKVKPLFPQEHTHTSVEGAKLNAECVAEGIRGLKDVPLAGYLLPAAPAVVTTAPATP